MVGLPHSASEQAKSLASKVLTGSSKAVKGVRDTVLRNRNSLKDITTDILDKGQLGKDVDKQLEFFEELGKGTFGVTRRGVLRNKDPKDTDAKGLDVAVKSLFKRNIQTKEDVDDIRREVSVLSLLDDHPNVVHLKACFEDKHHVHIAMELCTGGELLKRVLSKRIYSEHDAATIMRTIMEVVAFCHEIGLVHRDLKPDNFLLASDADNAPVKAIDFGLATFYTKGQLLTDVVGTSFYMAPEVLKQSYGPECDIWSCGVILYVLLSGRPPFPGQTKEEIHKAVLKAEPEFESEPWPHISDAAKDLVKAMLNVDPAQRITAKEALENKWLKGTIAPKAPLGEEVLRRLNKFSEANNMKKVALKVVACSLSKKEIAGLKELFKGMDKDKSGTISFEELRVGLRKMGTSMTEEELTKLWQAADLDGSNALDYTEFLTATMALNQAQKEENIWKAFCHFDKDGSGQITKEELKQALAMENIFDAGDVEAIIAKVDKDKNGVVDYEEFIAMMRESE